MYYVIKLPTNSFQTFIVNVLFLFGTVIFSYGQSPATIDVRVLYQDDPITYGVINFLVDITNTTTSTGDYDITECSDGVAEITLDYDSGTNNYDIEIESVPTAWEGLNTQDIILIQRYLADLEVFDNYEFIAADSDKNGIIDTFDVNNYRQYILNPMLPYPGGNHWELLHDLERPFFELSDQDINLYSYLTDSWAANVSGDPSATFNRPYFTFRGIKRGDLNDDNCGYCINGCAPGLLRRTNYVKSFEPDSKNIRVDFKVSREVNISGFEIFLEDLPNSDYDITTVISEIEPFNNNNYAINHVGNKLNNFRSSWSTPTFLTLEKGQTILSIEVELHELSSVDELQNTLKNCVVKLFDENLNMNSNIEIQLSNLPTINNYPTNFYAHPNPFSNEIIVNFESSENISGEIVIVDIHGRWIKSKNYNALVGLNQVIIQTAELPNGIYVIQQKENGSVRSLQKLVK